MKIELVERYRGCLLGLACGDAVGTTLEFKSPGTFELISDMIGGGPFHLQPGQWTDDTSMALCLAESLVESGGFDANDQMKRYVGWWRQGIWSSTGICFDIGNTIRQALSLFEKSGNAFAGSEDVYSAGNGSIMRLAPIPMYYRSEREQVPVFGALSSKTTHAARTAVDACRLLAVLITGALEGVPKNELLGKNFSLIPGYWAKEPLCREIAEVAAGSYKVKKPPEIKGTGYVVKSLEAALWAFYRTDSFRDGVLMAANLGDDADTTAAVFGQLAGAFYGAQGIPQSWIEKVTFSEKILSLADRLYQQSIQEQQGMA